ncbi:MAG: dephospho-CoA kinase [Caldilineae bacterium]|nr:MAG: dephospho-CoA kinase [Caldilineae bacterium]
MNQKYIIGLTGNIATGKSIVRRMLQELGASTIDADGLVHMLQRPGTPVYKEIVDTFGSFILNKDATINRKRLSDIAFSVPEAMQELERIIHPAVRKQLDRVVAKAPTYVVVIEAIKLIESGLADQCNAVWVVTAPEEAQMVRLITKRNMSSQDALKRVQAQPPQAEKVARADVVIDNSGDLVRTWNLVQKEFGKIPKPTAEPAPAEAAPAVTTVEAEVAGQAPIDVRRAKRGDLLAMAQFIGTATNGEIELDEGEMMERLFSKGYMLAFQKDELVGLVGWQTENLIAGIDDLFVKSSALWPSVGKVLLDKVEEAVRELSCEAGLIFLHNSTGPVARKFLEKQGYEAKKPEELIKVWREAAEEWQVENTTLMVKQLLERRVMVPI